MVQPVPLPPAPPSESMGVEGSGSGLGSEKTDEMEKSEVKESIDVLEVGVVRSVQAALTWEFSSGGADDHKLLPTTQFLYKTKWREEDRYGKQSHHHQIASCRAAIVPKNNRENLA